MIETYLTYGVIALSFIFMASYFLGKAVNNKRQKRIWKTLLPTLKPHMTSLKIMRLGSSGFKAVCTIKGASLRKLEADLLLLDRENILHYPLQRQRGRHDQLVMKANLLEPPPIQLDIVSKAGKIKDIQGGAAANSWTDIEVEGLTFKVNASHVDAAKRLLNYEPVARDLQALGERVGTISISSSEPHVSVLSVADDRSASTAADLVFKLGDAVKKLR